MSEKPCEKEEKEHLKAIEEYNAAANLSQSFASTEPIDPHKDKVPLSIEKSDQMGQAFDAEKKARKKYEDTLRAHEDCLKKLGSTEVPSKEPDKISVDWDPDPGPAKPGETIIEWDDDDEED